MRVADDALPGCAPRVLGQHPGAGRAGDELPAAGRPRPVEGPAARRPAPRWPRRARSARTLARIHAYSAARPALAAQFDTDAIFFDIRLEPYLLATAARHPDLAAAAAGAGGADAGHTRRAGPRRRQPEEHPARAARPGAAGRRVRLVGRPGLRPRLLPQPPAAQVPVEPGGRARPSCAASTHSPTTYLQGVNWEPRAALEQRAAALLPGLLLARVDGKSPVEYLTARRPARHRAPGRARPLLQPVPRLAAVGAAWRRELDR